MNKLNLILIGLISIVLSSCKFEEKKSNSEVIDLLNEMIDNSLKQFEIDCIVSYEKYQEHIETLEQLQESFKLTKGIINTDENQKKDYTDFLESYNNLKQLIVTKFCDCDYNLFENKRIFKKLDSIIIDLTNNKSNHKDSKKLELYLTLLEKEIYSTFIENFKTDVYQTNSFVSYLIKTENTEFLIFSAIDSFYPPLVIDTSFFNEKLEYYISGERGGKKVKFHKINSLTKTNSSKLRNDSIKIYLKLKDGSLCNEFVKHKVIDLRK